VSLGKFNMKVNKFFTRQRLSYLQYIVLAMILSVVLYVRLRLLHVPLERDEGEYAYMGQLMLKGIPPYLEAYTMKLPGVCALYAVFMVLFGHTVAGIHLGLLFVNGISVFLTYLLANRLLGREAAILSCATYAVLSLSYSVLGVFAHATHFVVLFILSGFVLLLHYTDRWHLKILFLSALCFGLACIMKQHAALLASFALFYLLWCSRKNIFINKYRVLADCGVFVSGMIMPYLVVIICIIYAGVFERFWFWTMLYAQEYVSEIDLALGWNYFYQNFGAMVGAQLPLWFMSGMGGVFLCLKRTNDVDKVFLFGFFLFSLFAVCPGWYFRPHYFIMMLPAVSLLAGVVAQPSGLLLSSIRSLAIQYSVLTILLISAFAYACYRENDYYFSHSPRQVSRATYALSPFPEALPIARYIKDHTETGDRIAVLGSEPEIFFYADRLSATKHIYMYGLMEDQKYAEQMQKEIIRNIEDTNPKYVVMVNIMSSWLASTFSRGALIDWAEKYVKEHYDVVGIIDIVDYNTTYFLWDGDAKDYEPMGKDFITVLKRKEGI
jgi:hypothetical protein